MALPARPFRTSGLYNMEKQCFVSRGHDALGSGGCRHGDLSSLSAQCRILRPGRPRGPAGKAVAGAPQPGPLPSTALRSPGPRNPPLFCLPRRDRKVCSDFPSDLQQDQVCGAKPAQALPCPQCHSAPATTPDPSTAF